MASEPMSDERLAEIREDISDFRQWGVLGAGSSYGEIANDASDLLAEGGTTMSNASDAPPARTPARPAAPAKPPTRERAPKKIARERLAPDRPRNDFTNTNFCMNCGRPMNGREKEADSGARKCPDCGHWFHPANYVERTPAVQQMRKNGISDSIIAKRLHMTRADVARID